MKIGSAAAAFLAITGCTAHPQAAEIIDWAPVPPGVLSMGECGTAKADGLAACLVRRPFSSRDVVRIARDGGVHRSGRELTFAYEGAAKSVLLQGGVVVPLSHLRGTDLWFVTVRIDDIDRAIVNYAFFARMPGVPPRKVDVQSWRGPAAPPAAPIAATLRGTLSTTKVSSRFLSAAREVSIYTPPAGSGPIAQVLYLLDGEALESHARVVDALIARQKITSTLIVAPHSAPDGAYGEDDGRALEYLINYSTPVGEPHIVFENHERFFVDDLLPWAEETLGAPQDPARRIIGGFSNGGAFAIQIALRHPNMFRSVFSISPGGRDGVYDPGTTLESKSFFYLSGGLFEPTFHRNATGWARLLRQHNVAVMLREPLAGHDPVFFRDALADALVEARAQPLR